MKPVDTFTFEDYDQLDLKKFCERLESYLMVENDYVEGSLVIALNAGFGSGKSTFIEMWKNSLLSRRGGGEFVPMPVVLNAWESDHCGDPLLAILAGLIGAVENWVGKDSPDGTALKEAAKDIGWFATAIANEFTAKWTGIDFIKAGDFAEAKNNSRAPAVPTFVEIFQHRVDLLKDLKFKLTETFGGAIPKVIVFVDELDRCRPDYAVNYLEIIKHVFNAEGLVFVLAVDYPHLANSAKALFGSELNFDEYFRKFCHRPFDLPLPDQAAHKRLAETYIEKYLEIEGKRSCIMETGRHRVEQIAELAIGLKMRPRQIQESFRIIGHALATGDDTKKGKLFWCLGAATILLSMLKVADRPTYYRIGSKTISHEEVGQLLIELVGNRKAYWWFRVYLLGAIDLDDRQSKDPESIFRSLNFVTGPYDSNQELSQFVEGWGGMHGSNRLDHFYRRIENAESF